MSQCIVKLKIKSIINDRRTTIGNVASELGITRQHLGSLLSGKYDISFSMLVRISEILNVPFYEMFEDTRYVKNPEYLPVNQQKKTETAVVGSIVEPDINVMISYIQDNHDALVERMSSMKQPNHVLIDILIGRKQVSRRAFSSIVKSLEIPCDVIFKSLGIIV